VFLAALSGGNLTKGVLAGVIGLMLSSVGLDAVSSTQRSAFASAPGS
jgi:TctA family transporter